MALLGLFRVLMLLQWLLLLVMIMMLLLLLLLLLMVVMVVMVMMAFDPDALALASSPLFLIVARAQPPSVLFVPGAQGLAPECEVVIFNDSGDHPWVAPKVDLADGWVCDVEIRDEEVGLGGPVGR